MEYKADNSFFDLRLRVFIGSSEITRTCLLSGSITDIMANVVMCHWLIPGIMKRYHYGLDISVTFCLSVKLVSAHTIVN